MFKVVLLLAAISGSLALTNFDKCSTGEIPNHVEINHCDEAPCTFYKGDKIEANFNGVPASDSANATFNVDRILAGTRTPITLPDSNACPHIHPGCPIKQGEHIEYKFEWVIPETSVGGVPVTMEHQLKGDDEMNIFCISFPATVFPTTRPDGPTTTTEATPTTDTTVSDADTTPTADDTTTTVSEADTTTISEADTTTVSEADTTTASEADTTTISEADTTTVSEADTTTASDAETTTASDVETTVHFSIWTLILENNTDSTIERNSPEAAGRNSPEGAVRNSPKGLE